MSVVDSNPGSSYDLGTSAQYRNPSLTGSDIQEVSITDLISEGPIEGLVHGEGSVYLDGDTLEDKGNSGYNSNTVLEATAGQAYGEPKFISVPAASSNNGPVTCTHKDASGTTAYFDNLEDTTSSDERYRWLRVHSIESTKVKIEGGFIYNERAQDANEAGMLSAEANTIYVCAVNDQGAEVDFFSQSQISAAQNRTWRYINLRSTIRITLPVSGQEIEGTVRSLFGADFDTADNSGLAKRAIIQLDGEFSNGIKEEDFFVSSSNEVYGEVNTDRIFKCDIKADNSGNKSIYIPQTSTSAFGVDKTFSLSAEQYKGDKSIGVRGAGSNMKYPGSSLEFRVGELHAKPLYQLSGMGVSSFPLTLTSSDLEPFESTNAYSASLASDYPNESDIQNGVLSGMVQKNIVFSSSFTGAQINEIDQVRIQFEFPGGHFATDEQSGDWSAGAAFNIKLYGSESGGANPTDWQDLTAGTFAYWKKWGLKKTSVAYSCIIDINTHYNIRDLKLRITRLTPDGVSKGDNKSARLSGSKLVEDTTGPAKSAVVDTCKIAQIVCTINQKLRYPFSAVASVNFSSKSFPNPPKRAYHVRGLRVKIPSNYTPRHLSTTGAATYTGIWNGEFSNESDSLASGLSKDLYYTDNPAWVFYDILTNNRYGLGAFLEAQDINKFQLYKIAKYCDELVPASLSGTSEPRFTANLYLTKATEAYKVLKDMATIFRGILYWLDGEMTAVHDGPATPIYNFSDSNIIRDSLAIQNAGSKARANQYTVLWNNPLSAYKLEPIILEDRQNILDTGKIIRQKATAFGCTSEGQAIRYGRWKAWTAINQTQIAVFKTSVNASFLVPGDIINLQEESVTGVAFSGRITGSSNSAITLDVNVASTSTQTSDGRSETFAFGSGSDYSYALSLLVTTRKVVLAQDAPVTVTHSGTAHTYNRGDSVVYAKIGGTSTQLIGGSDSDEQVRKNITNIQDDSGNDIIVDFRNSTSVETKTFTSSNVSVTNGVTQIAISSAFSGTIPANTIWAIKETFKGVNTEASYKEYKILGIKEDNENNYEITAVEFYNSKFSTIDTDFALAVSDPVKPPELDFVPGPSAVYVLQTPDYRSEQEEITLQWEPPRNADGSLYDFVRGFYIHAEPRLPSDEEFIPILDAGQLSHKIVGVPNGSYSFGVQTITQLGKKSRIKWQPVDINDKFAHPCSRTAEGIPEGIRANVKFSSSGSTFSFKKPSEVSDKSDWAVQSQGAPNVTVNNANQGTAATYSQVLTSMASGSGIATAFIYFDADSTSDYLKLTTHTTGDFENTSIGFWQEHDQFITNSENVWVDCTNSADARVKLHKNSNKVEKSTGTTAFNSRFQIGDIIRIKTAANTYYAGKVSFIESDDVLFTDVKLNTTDADLTSSDEAKAIARNGLRTDPKNDAIIAKISRSGSTYTHTPIRFIEDLSLTGLRAIIPDLNISALNYNSSAALQNNAAITLTATALAYDAPEFKVTGAGFSGLSGSAHGDFTTTGVSGQVLTYQLHNGSSDISMGDKSPLEFTVQVRESADDSNVLSTTLRIIKVQDGSIGSDGKTVTLDSDDYSIIYDEEGENPSYTSSGGGDIDVTATARNFTDPLYRFTFDGGSAGAWRDTTGTQADEFTYASASIPATYDKTHWPKVLLVEVGEKPDSYSAGDAPTNNLVEATDSISIVGIKTGSGGVSLVNSNQAHTYTTDLNGKIGGQDAATILESGTTLELIVGGVVYAYIGKTDGTYGIAGGGEVHDNKEWYIESAAVVGNDLTIGGPTSAPNNKVTIGTHSTTADTEPDEVITYTCKYKQAGDIKTITTTQTLSKSITGDTGQAGATTKTISIYKVSNSNSASTTVPEHDATITYSTGAIAWPQNQGLHSNLWYDAPPNTSATARYVHRRQAIITAPASGDTVTVSGQSGGSYSGSNHGWGPSGIVVTHPTSGSPGDSGKRSVQGYIYFRTTSNSNPFTSNSQKTGVYNFSSGIITEVSTGLSLEATAAGGFSNEPYIVDVASSDSYWTARYSFTDADAGETSNTVTVNITNAVAHTTFSGVVTFNGSTFSSSNGNYDTTAIDGGTITTGTIQGPSFPNTGGITGGGTKLALATSSLNNTDSIFEVRKPDGAAVFKITKAGAIQGTGLTVNDSAAITGGTVGGWTMSGSQLKGETANEGRIILDSSEEQITIEDYVGSDFVTRVILGKLP